MPNSSPPRKRSRFFIENLLASSPPPLQHGGSNNATTSSSVDAESHPSSSSDLGAYVRELDGTHEYNKKFKMGQYRTTYIVENLPPNPEALLHTLFEQCIQAAIKSSAEISGHQPDRVGAMITSRLFDYDLYIPIREIHEDTADNMLNQFLKVVQSRKRNGQGNVLGAPFTIYVHTVSVAALPQRRQIRGRGRARGVANFVHHQINPSALIRVNNPNDPYCLFYAMEFTRRHAQLQRQTFWNYHNGSSEQHRVDVHNLMRAAGIPFCLESYDAIDYAPRVIDAWNSHFAAQGLRFKVFVFGEMGHYLPIFRHGPDDFNVPIPLFFSGNHFHGVRNAGTLLKRNNKYCFSCLTPYRRDSDHNKDCGASCANCGRVGPGRPCKAQPGFADLKCQHCNRVYTNADCYTHHLRSGECGRTKRCEHCGVPWSVKHQTRDGRAGHVCGEDWCNTCFAYHNLERGCFIKPLEAKKPEPYRKVTFDFEAMQHRRLCAKKRIHEVNFIAAKISCSDCIASGRDKHSLIGQPPCKICGPYRSISFSMRPHENNKIDRQEVSSQPLQDFMYWLLFECNPKYKTIAFSHFGGKYDLVLLFKEFFTAGFIPDMIKNGNKLYEMKMPKLKKCIYSRYGQKYEMDSCELIFRDSFNLCPAPLGDLVGAFGLSVQEKQFFPHLANHPDNFDRVLPELPPKSDYLYGGMNKAKQQAFNTWYEAEKAAGATFNLNEKLAEYCWNDVEILSEALLAFRAEFFDFSSKGQDPSEGIDVLHDSITISSGCIATFRKNYLQADHIAIVPHRGYDSADNQSKLALRYLNWYAEQHNVDVKTAYNGREHKVGPYRLDGYVAAEDRAIEVNGCFVHAHECKFSNPDFVMPSGKTVRKIREKDAARLEFLRDRLRGGVDVIWECQIEKEKRRSKEMQKSFEEYRDEGPIKIREAFTGGRTGPFRMHYKREPGWKIGYVDFCSLYPHTTAANSYPVGHPKLHVIKRAEQTVNWTRAEDIPVKGLLKVFIVPPEKTVVPVMPVKFDERLLFPLCRKCSLLFPKGAVMQEYQCPHTEDFDRGWVSTCTSLELAEALAPEGGYRVIRYYRSLEWDEWDGDLFRGYVAQCMEAKIHASGFPQGINTQEREDRFIQECKDLFGILIDRHKMKPNKAKRMIAKLMANNLWGRFSLRNGLTKTFIAECPSELRQYLDNKAIVVSRLDELTPDFIMITYEPADDMFVEENCSSNIVLSLWTTSCARIRLLKELRKVIQAGAIPLYTDTDSIIFAYKEADGYPVETGPHLGDLTVEYPDYEIDEFVSGGCKAYSLRMVHKTTGEEKGVLRLRGITLSGDVCEQIHLDSFKEAVLNFGNRANGEGLEKGPDDWTLAADYPNFIMGSVAQGTIVSQHLHKRYQPIISKGVVSPGLIIKDFGSR